MFTPEKENLFEELSKWLQPQHLTDSAIEEFKSALAQTPEYGVCIENFIQEDILERIAIALEEEAEYEEFYKLYSERNRRVDKETFDQTPDEDKFLYRRSISGAKAEYRLSMNWMTYIKFCFFFETLFPRFLELISNYSVKLSAQNTHSHQQKHFLRKHNDFDNGKRRVCSLLYLSPKWTPECGGALVLQGNNDGKEKKIEAIFNRLALFYSEKEIEHFVEPHSTLAKNMCRIVHVAWFNDRTIKSS